MSGHTPGIASTYRLPDLRIGDMVYVKGVLGTVMVVGIGVGPGEDRVAVNVYGIVRVLSRGEVSDRPVLEVVG